MLIQIMNEKFKRAILNALSDEDMVNILNASQEKLVSVQDIIKEHNISHTTAYRKIKWMLENDLISIKKMEFTNDGKKFSLFKSTILSVNIKYENNVVTVEEIKNMNILEETAAKFFSLDDVP